MLERDLKVITAMLTGCAKDDKLCALQSNSTANLGYELGKAFPENNSDVNFT
jgi:hypothetical protein